MTHYTEVMTADEILAAIELQIKSVRSTYKARHDPGLRRLPMSWTAVIRQEIFQLRRLVRAANVAASEKRAINIHTVSGMRT